MVTLPICDQIDLLNQQRRHIVLEWMDYYGIKQAHIIEHSSLGKRSVSNFIKYKYNPDLLVLVENAVMDLLGVGPLRYVYYEHPGMSMQTVLKMYCIHPSQVCMPWQPPSDTHLCINLKLY